MVDRDVVEAWSSWLDATMQGLWPVFGTLTFGRPEQASDSRQVLAWDLPGRQYGRKQVSSWVTGLLASEPAVAAFVSEEFGTAKGRLHYHSVIGFPSWEDSKRHSMFPRWDLGWSRWSLLGTPESRGRAFAYAVKYACKDDGWFLLEVPGSPSRPVQTRTDTTQSPPT